MQGSRCVQLLMQICAVSASCIAPTQHKHSKCTTPNQGFVTGFRKRKQQRRKDASAHSNTHNTTQNARRDFVTGFRKRKQQRRKDAQKQLETKAKQDRQQQRSEVRA